MIENILIMGSVGGIITSLVMFWKLSDKWKAILLKKINGKETTDSLDLDNLIRFVIVITGIFIIWVPVIYLISIMFNTNSNRDYEKYEIRTKSFKEFLIDQKVDIDIRIPNKFESISTDNKYSNQYFGFSTVLPKDFQVDRGNFNYTIIRCFKEEKGTTISISVTPLMNLLSQNKIENVHKSFQKNPLSYLNKKFDGNFKNHILNTLKSNSTLEIKNLEVGEKKIRSTYFAYTKTEYIEEYNGEKIEVIKLDYQTILWGNSFGFSYNSPKKLFNEHLINDILLYSNFIKPY